MSEYDEDEEISLGKLQYWNMVAHVHDKEIAISVGGECLVEYCFKNQ